MIRFNNDYNVIAHPRVMEYLQEYQGESYAGYGEDVWCEKAANLIRKKTGAPEAAVYFLPGATQANYIVVAAALSPVESVICADTGHIFCHEAASIENTGHKLLTVPNHDGKITAADVAAEAAKYYDGGQPEYLTEPRLVYLSLSTEVGTVYTKAELAALHEVCQKYGMCLFVDGARLGYGLGAEGCDITLQDLAALTDVFYIGGTKCGAMFGEALVLPDKTLQRRFKAYMKQNGAVLAKGWLMGMQFCALLEDDLYFAITRRADEQAMQLRDAFRAKGIQEAVASPTNQQFVRLTEAQKAKLAEQFTFEDEGDSVRFCTSWATKPEELATLIAAIEKL